MRVLTELVPPVAARDSGVAMPDSVSKTGNRTRATNGSTSVTYAYNTADQLCWAGTPASSPPPSNDCSDTYSGLTQYGYDANGNQTSITPPTGAASARGYTAYNQTATTTGGGQPSSTRRYTGTGQSGLVALTDVLGTTTRPVTLTNTALGMTSRTTTNPDNTDAWLRTPAGTLLTWRTNTKEAYLTDRQGSVLAVVNTATGKVDRRYTYDPFGAVTAGTFTGDTNPYRYTGAYTDNTTATVHLGARWYQPTTGTFTQPDPSHKEANNYLYTGANPVNRTDPSGLFFGISWGDVAAKGITAAVTAVGTAAACGATAGLGCVAGGVGAGIVGGALGGAIGSAIDGDDHDETVDNVGKNAALGAFGGAVGGGTKLLYDAVK